MIATNIVRCVFFRFQLYNDYAAFVVFGYL